jgi:pimeloyl-ACP methyl ester carboxylesterase
MKMNTAMTNNSFTEVPGKVTNINGIDLYYELYAHPNPRKTIFFIHGFLSSCFCFRQLIPSLNKQYQIISVDMPPFGKSGKSKKFVYSYNNIAKTMIGLLDFLEIEEVVLIGHSMGGQICLNMMHEQSDRFERAVLLASSGYLQKARRWAVALSYLPFSSSFVKKQLVRTGGVQGNLESVIYDTSIITEEMKEGYLQPFLTDEGIFSALAKLLRDREGDLSSDELNNIKKPCLLIWGKEDKIVPLSVGNRLEKDLPNASLIVLEETGHLVPEEKPQETIRLIEEFLNQEA